MNREGPERRRNKGLWWDKALYLVHGCTPVSEGCGRCWAAAASAMRAHHPNAAVQARNAGLTMGSPPRFNGVVRLDPAPLDKLIRAKKPRVWAVWNDLFHPDVPEAFIDDCFSSFVDAKEQTVVVLTKRPQRMAEYMGDVVLPNVFSGTSAENQPTADARLPHLAKLVETGWRTVLSIEPMLGPVNVSPWLGPQAPSLKPTLSGVILGGQTGSGAVPLHPDWVRKVRDDCQEAGVPFYLKSLGPGLGRALDGRTWDGLAWGRGGKA